MRRSTEILILVVILAAAAWLRFRGLDWGLPQPYHPDEGSILFHSLAFGTGDLNPHWFRWPSFLMYVMFGVYGGYYLLGRLVGTFGAPVDLLRGYLTDLSPFWLMGRWVSALAGVATVWVTYRIGRRAFDAFVGLVAALFMAVVYLHVRDSHYATPDVVTTFLAALSLLAAVRALDSGRVGDLVLSGFLAGLAASTKYPGVLAAAGTLAAYIHLATSRKVPVSSLFAAAGACAAGFVVGTPYSVLSYQEFARDVTTQLTMVSTTGVEHAATSFAAGLREVFAGSVGRGVGYPILALAVLGVFLRRGRVAESAGRRISVVAAYAAAVFAVMIAITVKRSTYLTPALPAMALLAAAGVEGLGGLLARPLKAPRHVLAVTLAVLVALVAVIPSVRFGTALAAEDTRTQAARWIEANVPPGAVVAVEDYGPVLNLSVEQLSALVDLDSTAVGAWEAPQRRLNELRLEVGRAREPQFVVYGIGCGPSPFRLPRAYEDASALIASVERLGAEFVVLSSKAVEWRRMEGAANRADAEACAFRDWVVENGALRERFVAETHTPPIDRGDGRSFHNPVIEVFEISRTAGPSNREGL
ncbi:MAG: glycosyltransferase family 39 protein [Candidatus Eisenbacteria bacterium]